MSFIIGNKSSGVKGVGARIARHQQQRRGVAWGVTRGPERGIHKLVRASGDLWYGADSDDDAA